MINPIDQKVGLRIRDRRIAMKLAQEVVANALGISFQQLQKYESGKNRIAASRIYALAAILKVTPSYFFDLGQFQSAPAPIDPAEVVSQSDEGRRLNQAFWKIKSNPLRESIIELIEKIAASAEDVGLSQSHTARRSAIARTGDASTRSDSDGT